MQRTGTLRIALFAATEPAPDDGDRPRGLLTVGGRAIVQHQLDIALALGCRRVICLASRVTPELTALQQEVAAAGAQLQVLAGARSLTPQVAPDDELIVLDEGLLVNPREVIALLEEGQGVLVQPIAGGLAAGFERIDGTRAAGGAMRLPGTLVERLAELPADCDVPSALLRIALQAQVPTRDIPADALVGTRWTLVRNEAEAQRVEAGWIALHLGTGRGATPSERLARLAIGSFGASLLHAGSHMVTLAAGVTILLALTAGWLGWTAAGLVLVAFGWLLRQGATMLQRVEQGSLRRRGLVVSPVTALTWLADAAIVLLASWGAWLEWADSLAARAFAPLMLVGLVRLLPPLLGRRWACWIEDRALIALMLALADGLDALELMVEALALALLVLALVVPRLTRRSAAITPR